MFYNHRYHEKGSNIRTSPVVSVMEKSGEAVVNTKTGSMYILGEPKKGFIEFVKKLSMYKEPESNSNSIVTQKIAIARASLGLLE